MKKEITLYGLIMLIITATILSALTINFVLVQYGITSDYVFSNLQNITEEMQDGGYFSTNVSNDTLMIVEEYQKTILILDDIWFAIYILFIMFTLTLAYRIKTPTDINFFLILLFGIFIFLFMGYFSDIFVNWFTNNITLKLMPDAMGYFPKYSWYVANIGLINTVHAVILLLISRLNFQFGVRDEINRQETESLDSEEIN